MLEEILLFAIKFENCLPPVENRNNTGWWPHYDLEYPDPDMKIIEGDVEVYYAVLEWLTQIPRYDQRVIYAYLGTGHRVSDEVAARKLKIPKGDISTCPWKTNMTITTEVVAGRVMGNSTTIWSKESEIGAKEHSAHKI